MVIVFDAVGTLIRTTRPVADVYHNAGQQFGSQLNIEQVGQKFKFGRKQIFRTALRDSTSSQSFPSSDSIERELWRKLVHFIFDDVESPDELFDWLWDYFSVPSSWELFDDTIPCLQDLKKLNLSVCIGSNFDSRIGPIFAHWLPNFVKHNLHWSSKAGCRKPDREFYHYIAERNADDQRFVMIGDDRINDYQAPLEFGWNAILLDRQDKQDHDLCKIVSLLELTDKLRSNF